MLTRRRPRRPESYYSPKRADLTAGVAISAAIGAALYRGVHRWLLIVRGVRRLDPAHGLWLFLWEVIRAAIIGAVVGAAIGWTLGFVWERWHRWRRARRHLA